MRQDKLCPECNSIVSGNRAIYCSKKCEDIASGRGERDSGSVLLDKGNVYSREFNKWYKNKIDM